MSNVRGTLLVGSTTPLTAGVTQTTRNQAISGLDKKTNDFMFAEGVIGVSVTHYQAALAPSWAIEVYADLGGFEALIAGITGLGSTTSTVVPITDANGATQSRFLGIPSPTTIDIVGSSTTVGTTFGCLVTLTLHN